MPDSTSIQNVEIAVASTLVSDFNKKMSSIKSLSLNTTSKYSSIQNQIASISPVDFTPPAIFQATTDTATNTAFESSSWLMAEDAGAKIQEVTSRCDILEDVPLGAAIEKMRGGVLDDAKKAASDAIEAAKEQLGLSMPEFAIGETLSDIVNKGRAAYEAAEDALQESVSDILESGKAGLAKAQAVIDQVGGAVSEGKKMIQKGLETLTPALKKLDEIINCMDAVGGEAVVGQTDEMIDSLNTVYDQTQVHSDPSSPTFGEFDSDTFFSQIPGITPDQKSNLLKATNSYDKIKNNSSKVVDKAKDFAEKDTTKKSVSALAGGSEDSITEKKTNIKKKTEVVFDTPATPAIPAAPATETSPARPAQPAQPAEETPAPEPAVVPVPDNKAAVQEDEDLVPNVTTWKNLVKEIEVDETDMAVYLSYDPNRENYPRFKTDFIEILPLGGTLNPTPDDLTIIYSIPAVVIDEVVQESTTVPGTNMKYTQVSVAVEANLTKLGTTTTGFLQAEIYTLNSRRVPEDEWQPRTAGSIRLAIKVGVDRSIRKMSWSANELEIAAG